MSEFSKELENLFKVIETIRNKSKLLILADAEFYRMAILEFESKFGIKVVQPTVMGISFEIGKSLPRNRKWVLALK